MEKSTRTSKRWVIDPSDELPPVLGNSGFAARPPETVIHVLRNTVRTLGNESAMAVKRTSPNTPGEEPRWMHWTWNDLHADAQAFAKTLIALEIPLHHVVNILGFNSV